MSDVHTIESAQADARHEAARGCAVEPAEARRRALRRADKGDRLGAVYWLAYAETVDAL